MVKDIKNTGRKLKPANKDELFSLLHKAQSLISDGRVDDAIGIFKEIISKHDDFVPAHYGLGMAYMMKEDFKACINEFKKAVDLDPGAVEPHLSLALTYSIWKG